MSGLNRPSPSVLWVALPVLGIDLGQCGDGLYSAENSRPLRTVNPAPGYAWKQCRLLQFAMQNSPGKSGPLAVLRSNLEVSMSEDSQLQSTVLAELNWEPSLVAGRIGVTVNEGVVTLSGHVESYVHKHAAEEAARRVKGVLAVADEIVVDLPAGTMRSDADIAAAVVERLAWDSSIVEESVKATVVDGWVTLTGRVDRHYQSEAAVNNVRNLRGVTGVTNEITIRPWVNTENLCNDISLALNRSWYFDQTEIKVTAAGGKIRLSGTVRSPHERLLAANVAWSAPGVVAVENDIAVV
jgi:osmotically-inducible protein OsmY